MYYHTSKTRTSTQRRPRPKSGGHSCLELEIGVVGLGGWCSTHRVLLFGEEETVVVEWREGRTGLGKRGDFMHFELDIYFLRHNMRLY